MNHKLLGLLVGVSLLAWACGDDVPSRTSTVPPPTANPHSITLVARQGSPRVETDLHDGLGRPVTLSCGTCHAHKAPDPKRRDGATLTLFHQGLVTAHGDQTCISCHDQGDYTRLRLADGTPVAFTESKTLCRQCHGPQARDYARGSHGGMTGHWDLRAGPRTRNTCTVCHDAHAPAFVGMIPAPGPRDRGTDGFDPPAHGVPHHE